MPSDVSQILGVIVGAALTAFGVLLQFMLTERRDKRRSNEAKQRRKIIAYARLKELVERIESKFQAKEARLTEEEYDKLQETVADNLDVLEESTITAWNAKKISRMVYGQGSGPYEINLDQFCQEIKQQYQKIQSKQE